MRKDTTSKVEKSPESKFEFPSTMPASNRRATERKPIGQPIAELPLSLKT